MRRGPFVQNKVVQIYKNMDTVSFPIRPESVLRVIQKDCRILSYQELARAAGCGVEDIIAANKSRSGATSLDKESGRFLILYNADMNEGRIRWTLIHEIAHIALGHLETEHEQSNWEYEEHESEADFFTWNLLAPLPIIQDMGLTSASEIEKAFGLSAKAAAIQYERYKKWLHHVPAKNVGAWNIRGRILYEEEKGERAMERSILLSYHRKKGK